MIILTNKDMVSDPALINLWQRAELDTGLNISLGVYRRAVKAGNVILSFSGSLPVAFIVFQEAVIPDTQEHVLMERMLFVDKDVRGKHHADALVACLEDTAKMLGCAAILAGSSLNSNALAKRLYERNGFKTNYTFRKDI